MEKVVSGGKMAKKEKKKACGCKRWRRYEITSFCNTFLAVGNAEIGIWGGGWRVFLGEHKDLEGRMERLACEKKDRREWWTGRQAGRREKMHLFRLRILIPHIWEKYQGWSVDADCSWGADEAGPRRFKAKPSTQTPSALRVHGLTVVYTLCRMF